jgi:UDP-glucose 4-epimerase
MSKVFITGATGFIGKQLLILLSKKGVNLKILSRSSHPIYDTVVCDLLSDLIPSDSLHGVDTVFHLAGYTHDLRATSQVNHIYQSVNVDATIHLAKLAVMSGVKKYIFVSSVKAGGSKVSDNCLTEMDQEEPEDIYGKTKREAEIRLLEIGRESGMHISIIRPSLVYGPNAKGNLQLMQSKIIKGWFPPLPEIGNRRSMIHVDDLVQALILLAEDNRSRGQIYIATDGNTYSSRQIYEANCDIVGKAIPKWAVPKIIFNIASFLSNDLRFKINKLFGNECYSSEKLQTLGFKPRHSLREINETIF